MTKLEADSSLAERVQPSPNHGIRNGNANPDMIILHYTGMPQTSSALEWLCSPESQVSAHYVVLEDGRIVQCVAEARRAWHAGVSMWAGETDINSCSIGIEIGNPGHDCGYADFAGAQIAAVIALCRDIIARHGIAPHRVLGHSDVAPSRKRDPGEKFPWDRLHRHGVGHWVEPVPLSAGADVLRPGDGDAAVARLQASLAAYGYGIAETGAYDPLTEHVVTAFQRHFRPARVDGLADASTMATLDRLLAALPGAALTPRRPWMENAV